MIPEQLPPLPIVFSARFTGNVAGKSSFYFSASLTAASPMSLLIIPGISRDVVKFHVFWFLLRASAETGVIVGSVMSITANCLRIIRILRQSFNPGLHSYGILDRRQKTALSILHGDKFWI